MTAVTDTYLELYDRALEEWGNAGLDARQFGWLLETASQRPIRTGNKDRDLRHLREIRDARRAIWIGPHTWNMLSEEIRLRDRAAFGTAAR